MTRSTLLAAASTRSDHTAVIDSTGPSSYAQLSQYSARIANTLLLPDEHDLGEERIAYLIAPSFEYVATQWGIWRAGGVAVPLAVQHPTPELAYVFDDAQVSTVIVQPQLKDRVHEIAAARSIRLVTTDEISEVSSRVEFPELDPSRRSMILYTSGSTGRPKGVVATHANILAQIDALVVAWEWQRDDHVLNVLPMHHVHGIINVLSCALRVGATCEFQLFDEVGVWERFARGELTLFMGVPTIYAKLIASWHNASADQQSQWSRGAKKMRLMVSGSAALPVSTLEKWEQITGQRLLERYGMTEIGMALSNPLHGKRRAGFVGRPLPGVEVRRVDAANNLVEDATPGEIEVRGANVFHEYWNRPRETEESFRDGWFRTGDVAVVAQEDYRILGRSSVDIIKTGGYKVSALEIEDILRTHADICDCAVVGIPDDVWGERVAVCVVCQARASLELDALRQWAMEFLASYKVPTRMCLAAELPRNTMGKVQKPLVREMFTGG